MEEKKVEKKSKHRLGAAWITLLIVLVLTILTFIIAPLLISLPLFLIIYLPIILYILIYKWIGRWFAALVFSFSVWLNIFVLLVPVAGGLLVYDLMQFSQDFAESPKYLVLDDNKLIFGVDLSSTDFGIGLASNSQGLVLTQQQLQQFQEEISSDNVEGKIIFLVEKEVFRTLDTIDILELGITVSKDQMFALLAANNISDVPEEVLSQEFLQEQQNADLNQLKMGALFILLQEIIEKEGTDYLIEELKNGNIKIYPERLSLRILIKILPSNVFSSLLPEVIGIPELSEFSGEAKAMEGIRQEPIDREVGGRLAEFKESRNK